MGGPALVGREQQLQRLSRVVDEAFAGIGRLVLLSGEPGVGKTRVAVEVLDQARRRGARSVAGTCWDGAGAPGLWPWVQILRALRRELGDDGWAGASSVGGDALSRVLDSGENDENTPDAPREFHLFEATLQLLTRVCDDRPLVVLVDDLQWADAASLALMEFLHRHAVHLPMLVLGTYRADELTRPDHPQRLRLAELAQKALSIPLTGLDNDAIRQLRDDLGVSTSTAEAEHLRRLTGGNPFFVIESVAFRDPAESLGVRRAIDRRVDALGAGERQVLTVAALVGPEVADALIEAVISDGDNNDTTSVWAAVERSGLMRADRGQHAFVHDLVRESMRARLSADERRALYARIVWTAGTPELAHGLLPAQLAFLAMQAVPEISPAQAVKLLVAAATDASAHLTHEAAGRHLRDAADLTDDPADRARLTLQSGHAYHRAGALGPARERYRSLLEVGDVEVRARALVGLHRLGDPAAIGEPTELAHQLDAIHDDLRDSTDTALRAEILAARSRSRAHVLTDDRSEARPMAAQALELARAAGDETTVASCLLAYHDAIWEPGTEDERRSIAEELARTGRRLADPSVEAQGLLLRMVAELEHGDPGYLVTHEQFAAVADASGSPRLQFLAASRRGMIAALQAELPAARLEIDAARVLGERIGEPDALGVWCDQRWQIANHTGDYDTITDLLETLRGMGDPHWMVYEALVAAERGDVDRASLLAPRIAELGERWPRWAARLWDTFMVQIAVLQRDEVHIGELVERLERDAGHWAVLGGGVLVHGPICIWLGRLEAARGNWPGALAWSMDAEAAAHRLDAQLWVAEARADRLTAQHTMGTADHTEIASAISSAMGRGLVPIVERLEALGPTTTITARSPGNVFRRDHDIWTLVFDGVEVRMPDAKGLRDLHTLLANPGVDVPATSLATDAFVPGDGPPVLDALAKEAYRRRLDDLDADLDRAARRGDSARGESLEKERQALLDELRRAAGLGGRDRSISDERERLRKMVTARIRDTLRRLDDRHPALAAHLRASVHTGAFCVYRPAEPASWNVGP